MGKTKRYFAHLWKEWQKDEVTRHAATLSYFAIFSLPAFILVITSIAGVFIDEADVRTQFFAQIKTIAGESTATFLAASIENIQRGGSSVLMNVVGIVLLLVAAVGIFRELETSLNRILNVKIAKQTLLSRFVRSYLLSFLLLLVAATLLLSSLAAGSILIIVQSRLAEFSSVEFLSLSTLNQLLSYLSLGALFYVLYRFLPAKKFPVKAVLFGTVIATAFFILGTFLMTFYLTQANIGHAYGVASSVLVLLFWIFYSTNIFLLGAEIIDAYDRVIR